MYKAIKKELIDMNSIEIVIIFRMTVIVQFQLFKRHLEPFQGQKQRHRRQTPSVESMTLISILKCLIVVIATHFFFEHRLMTCFTMTSTRTCMNYNWRDLKFTRQQFTKVRKLESSLTFRKIFQLLIHTTH